MKLAEIEDWWWERVTGGDTGDAELVVRGDARLDAAGRVEVYRSMYFSRFAEILGGDHPALVAAVGDSWVDLVSAYIRSFPSTHPSIARAGDRLPEFLAAQPSAPPWLADLARVERARSRVFEAADADPIALELLRALAPDDWPALELRRIPASERVSLGWAVDVAWEQVERGAGIDPPEAADLELLVWRVGTTTRVAQRRVTESERALLEAFDAEAPFSVACDALSHLGSEAAPSAARGLIELVRSGVLCRPVDAAPGDG